MNHRRPLAMEDVAWPSHGETTDLPLTLGPPGKLLDCVQYLWKHLLCARLGSGCRGVTARKMGKGRMLERDLDTSTNAREMSGDGQGVLDKTGWRLLRDAPSEV